MHLTLGVDRLVNNDKIFRGKALGLITNQTGINSDGIHIADMLLAQGYDLRALFAPEHGIDGIAPDATSVEHSFDHGRGIKVFSIYNEWKAPTSEMLEGIEIMVVDLQDIGTRFYTYVSTIKLTAKVCAEAGIPMIIFDRPNPINGIDMEGPFIEPRFSSFVGHEHIPIRHGMTLGELMLFFNTMENINADITVLPLEGWDRTLYLDDHGLSFIPTSPSMQNLETAISYVATCFLEGTNLSEGRGTEYPFQQFGAPFLNARKVISLLNKMGLKGVSFKKTSFTPTENLYENQSCHGIAIEVNRRVDFQPFETGMRILEAISETHPEDFAWTSYPEVPGWPYIDYLTGTDKLRKKEISFTGLIYQGRQDAATFAEMRQPFLLY